MVSEREIGVAHAPGLSLRGMPPPHIGYSLTRFGRSRLKRKQQPESRFIFTSERGWSFAPAGFRKMMARLGVHT